MKIDWKVINNISKGIDSGFDVDAYSIFITNRFFSKFPDTILIANIMNEHHEHMTPVMNYLFFLNTVRPRYRYVKWNKSKVTNIDERVIEIIMKSQNISKKDATYAVKFMSDDEKTKMKNEWRKKYE